MTDIPSAPARHLMMSFRIMKDHAERMTATGPQTADAVPKVHAVDPPRSSDGTVVDGEDHTVTATKRHDLRPRLHSRPLLDQHELPAREVFIRLGEENGQLQRKD